MVASLRVNSRCEASCARIVMRVWHDARGDLSHVLACFRSGVQVAEIASRSRACAMLTEFCVIRARRGVGPFAPCRGAYPSRDAGGHRSAGVVRAPPAATIGPVALIRAIRGLAAFVRGLGPNARARGLRGIWVSGGEAEDLHFVGVLSFGDEFRDDGALGVFKRNSGRLWRSAVATTSSEGGMPGRMVRSREPKEFQTSWGKATARY